MKTQELIQGSEAWLAYRREHFNASDAPAMMGASPYTTRSELLHQMHTGLTKDVDAATQCRFDDGHRFEAMARPLAEDFVGMELYPVTGSEGKLSASFDGLTMCETIAFEHKSLNAELREVMTHEGCILPMMYRIQMEQQMLVSGCERVLFMASKWNGEELVEERHCWYESTPELREAILQGWTQFAIDLEAYTPKVVAESPKADPVMQLPALSIQIRGEVTLSNLPAFVSAADAFLAGIQTELETDQDFANAEANIKACDNAEKGIDQTKRAITAQAISIDEVMRTMDLYQGKLRTVRLKLTGLVKTEKEARKCAILLAAKATYAEHIASLEAEIFPLHLASTPPDFAGAMKNKRTLTSIHDAIDTELAQGKITADGEAKSLRGKLAWFKDNGLSFNYLFHDLHLIIAKPAPDFELTVTTRIQAHQAAEAKKEAEQRDRIRAEEQEKAEKASRETKEAEDALVLSFEKEARRIEFDSVPYIEKASRTYESTAKDWEHDPRPRVAAAYAAGRAYLKDRLEAAWKSEKQARDAIAAAQAVVVPPVTAQPVRVITAIPEANAQITTITGLPAGVSIAAANIVGITSRSMMSSTRVALNALLDRLDDKQLDRILNFCKSRYPQEQVA